MTVWQWLGKVNLTVWVIIGAFSGILCGAFFGEYAAALAPIGAVYVMLGRIDAAIHCYRQALAIKPDFAEAAGSMGSLLLTLGDLEEGLALERKGFGVIDFDISRGVSINYGRM